MAGDPRERRLGWLEDRLVETGELVGATGEASPGPWWGFSGVHTLAVTDQRLLVVRSTVLLHGTVPNRARVLASSVALADIGDVLSASRAGLLAQPEVWVLRLRVKGRRGVRICTFKDVEAGRRFTGALSRGVVQAVGARASDVGCPPG